MGPRFSEGGGGPLYPHLLLLPGRIMRPSGGSCSVEVYGNSGGPHQCRKHRDAANTSWCRLSMVPTCPPIPPLPLDAPTVFAELHYRQTLWFVWRNPTPYPPRMAASRTTRGPQRHRLVVVCRRGQVPPSREPSLQATLSPLGDLQRDRDHSILSVAQVDLALDC